VRLASGELLKKSGGPFEKKYGVGNRDKSFEILEKRRVRRSSRDPRKGGRRRRGEGARRKGKNLQREGGENEVILKAAKHSTMSAIFAGVQAKNRWGGKKIGARVWIACDDQGEGEQSSREPKAWDRDGKKALGA